MAINLTRSKKSVALNSEVLRGEAGGFYVPSVDSEGNLRWTATDANMPTVEPANIKGKDGVTPFGEMLPVLQAKDLLSYWECCKSVALGELGYIINIGDTFLTAIGNMKNGDVHEIVGSGTEFPNETYLMCSSNSGFASTNKVLYVVEKSDGDITYSIISDGKAGATGAKGAAGADGYSPTVETAAATGGTLVTITDAEGSHEFLVKNGTDGAKGEKGAKGDTGAAGAKGDTGAAGADGVSVTKVEVDENNHLQVTLSTGAVQDAGAINVTSSAGGSAQYELINSFTATQTDYDNGVKGFAFNTDINGNPFSLRAITAYAYIPAAESDGTFEIDLKNAGGALKAVVKRSEMLATAARWIKVEIELKGYWTGSMTVNSGANGLNAVYAGHHRNDVTNNAYYINLTSNIVLPVGSNIEVYGVRV